MTPKALSREIKKFIIRWSLKQVQQLPNMSYQEYATYGIEDVIIDDYTKEPMYILTKENK